MVGFVPSSCDHTRKELKEGDMKVNREVRFVERESTHSEEGMGATATQVGVILFWGKQWCLGPNLIECSEEVEIG